MAEFESISGKISWEDACGTPLFTEEECRIIAADVERTMKAWKALTRKEKDVLWRLCVDRVRKADATGATLQDPPETLIP